MASQTRGRQLGARPLIVGALVAVVVAVAALALIPGRSPTGPAPPPEGPGPGTQAPSFTLAALQSSASVVSFGKPDGRPTVLTFFGSWCVDCRQDVSVLATASRQLGSSVNFVGVDVADTRSAGFALVRSARMAYPVGFDPQKHVSRSLYDLYGLPATVFVNGRGQLVHTVVGAITQPVLAQWVSRAEA